MRLNMKILFLGNGFDLYHCFPTRYIDFLDVTNFIRDYFDDSIEFVGEVLGDERLQQINSNIGHCYETHRNAYDRTLLDKKKIYILLEQARSNVWFNYLSETVNKNIGWIDFEKEISKVVDAFKYLFKEFCLDEISSEDVVFCANNYFGNTVESYIINQFNSLFIDYSTSIKGEKVPVIKKKYILEYPGHSGIYEMDIDKLVEDLYSSLNDLSEMLKENPNVHDVMIVQK